MGRIPKWTLARCRKYIRSLPEDRFMRAWREIAELYVETEGPTKDRLNRVLITYEQVAFERIKEREDATE